MCFHKEGDNMKRSNEEKEAEAEAIRNWNPRYKHNVIIYCGFMAF
ncbi:hypothetical protein LABF186_00370 [Lactobacillus amylovorus subsp. animalium]|jgi:hypothetical protein|uniref:Uncharacterized protein n=1 Tax=Lactobacillus amylovorus subsp. animalium TaxID=3378536 RepID=A0ABD0BZ06_LACAM|nr:hypothetical protein LABF186_00370 [Lactobacillus amylovorus]GMM14904.1 hypothetical protein LABF125_00370 [Lactobacillus amylovorus]